MGCYRGLPTTKEFWEKLEKLHYILGFNIVPMVYDQQWPDETLKIIKENFKEEHNIYLFVVIFLNLMILNMKRDKVKQIII